MTKTKIKNLIKNSFFLDETRQTALLEKLEQLDEKQQNNLLEILQSEKADLKNALKRFIKSPEQIEELKNLLLRMGGKFSRAKENKSQNSDSQTAEALFNELENS